MEMHWVWISGIAFFATHVGISSTGLRGMLLARYGQQAYLGIYSVLAFATLTALVFTYNNTVHAPLLWPPLMLLPMLAMPLSLFLIVGGFTVPNPTNVGAEAKLAQEPRGALRITRHPVQWGLLLWASSHLVANGDPASIAFFGSMATVSALGMLAMDRRKSALPAWPEFAARTSLVPFVAIIRGRNRLAPGELVLPLAISAPLTVALWWLHPYLSGGIALM
jgi:uncharacterized membrane protein